MSDYDKEIKANLESKIKCISNKNIIINQSHLKKLNDKYYSHAFLNSGVPFTGPYEHRSVSKEKWVAKKTFT